MISRRFLLGAAPIALAARSVPLLRTPTPAPGFEGSTIGAGVDRAYASYFQAAAQGWITRAEIRLLEGHEDPAGDL